MKLRPRTTLTTMLLALLTFVCLLPTAQAFHHPRLGRFVQRDPLGYVDGMGLYNYLVRNPLAGFDPFGQQAYSSSMAAGVAAWSAPLAGYVEERDRAGIVEYYSNQGKFLGRKAVVAGQAGVKHLRGSTTLALAQYGAQNNLFTSRKRYLAWLADHDASQPCGPECSTALKSVLADVRAFWAAPKDVMRKEGAAKIPKMSDVEIRDCLCKQVFSALDGDNKLNLNIGRSWDINDLHDHTEGKPDKGYQASVRVNGTCYGAGAVNYVLYGLMGKLCNRTQEETWGRVKMWKRLKYEQYGDKDPETKEWLHAGWDGWVPGAKITSISPYSVARPATPPTMGKFTFTWHPFVHQGKYGEGVAEEKKDE